MASGLLYIVMHGCPDKVQIRILALHTYILHRSLQSILKHVMEPVLRKLGPAGWDPLDSKLAWATSKRPVWFQVLV